MLSDFFQPKNNPKVKVYHRRRFRDFWEAIKAKLMLNSFSVCNPIGVEVLARALMAGVSSREWLPLTQSVQPFVLMWQLLLLVKTKMGKSRLLRRAVGDLLCFSLGTDADKLKICSEKAPADAKT